jgi:hypothetical protein
MAAPAPDIFDGASPGAPRRLGLAPLGQHAPRQAQPLPELVRISAVRTAVTAGLALAGAVVNLFPLWAVLAAPAAFVLIQAVRRDVLRWTLWSVGLSAYLAEAMAAWTFPLRFAAVLLLVTPFVAYCGSILRAI